MLILTRADVEQLLDLDELEDALGRAHAELSSGAASLPPRIAAASLGAAIDAGARIAPRASNPAGTSAPAATMQSSRTASSPTRAPGQTTVRVRRAEAATAGGCRRSPPRRSAASR